jgi:ectoine hydroxylase-related dioxygenase (phytanoyl-CoA dioxygenase family)
MTVTATATTQTARGASSISAADLAFFQKNGYLVVRDLLTPDEVETLRRRANEVAAPESNYVQHNREARKELERRAAVAGAAQGGEAMSMSMGMSTAGGMAMNASMNMDMGTENMSPMKRADPASFPEERLTDQHGRRGPYVYNLRTRPVDAAAREAARASNDPFDRLEGTLENLADNDPVFRPFSSHPKLIGIMQELLGPNLKMWYDHLFSKPPYNDSGPYRGANRYHQDGFYFFSERSATCWIALDEVTVANGCLRYVPLTAGYGRFPQFDVVAHGIGVRELEQEVLLPLRPGDAAFHDRMVVHGTGPNETGTRRRGWAMHYTMAESRWGDFRNDPEAQPYTAVQTPDGLHLRNGFVTGNRDYLLASGQEFPGGV